MRLRELFENPVIETVRDKITGKNSLEIDDLDFMWEHSEPTEHKIRGLEIWEGDPSEIQEDGVLMLLIKDPRRDGFVGGLEINRAPEEHHFAQVFMVPELQGKNIAVELYKLAILEYGQILTTDETQTMGAESVWRKLSRDPEVDVYLWNMSKDKLTSWDPDEDDTTNAYYDEDEIEELRQEKKEFRGELMTQLMKGEITKDEFKDQVQKKFDQVDQYIQSLTSVKTDNVLLVAREAGEGILTNEEFEQRINSCLENANLQEAVSPETVDQLVSFIESKTHAPQVGNSGYLVQISAIPMAEQTYVRNVPEFSTISAIEDGIVYADSAGDDWVIDTTSNQVLMRWAMIFDSESQRDQFITLYQLRTSGEWKFEETYFAPS